MTLVHIVYVVILLLIRLRFLLLFDLFHFHHLRRRLGRQGEAPVVVGCDGPRALIFRDLSYMCVRLLRSCPSDRLL